MESQCSQLLATVASSSIIKNELSSSWRKCRTRCFLTREMLQKLGSDAGIDLSQRTW